MRYMKTMPSTEFRKTYTRETVVVDVHSNGHLIGWWVPAQALPEFEERLNYVQKRFVNSGPPNPGFNSRPFTPAPKTHR